MKKAAIKKIAVAASMFIAMGAASATAGEYQAGDFHQHSLYTDGSYPFMQVMAENANYGLDWWANSEHGGERNRDGNGNYWDDTSVYPINPILGDAEYSGGHQEMWRWQSLRDFVYPDIKMTRENYPDKTVISGLEQNVPGHEHCSTAIHQYDGTATAISEFEYRFDRSDDDTSRDGEIGLLGDVLSKTNDDKEDAILGVKWMQAMKDQGLGDAWVVPAHVERAWSYLIEDFRNWMDAGPDVAIGFEGAPGHQTSGDRGFSRGSLGGGTYGGTGFFVSQVGGLWDGLLAEGRKFYNFASSDYHNHWSTGGSDFWPGEYQKNYTYIDTDAEDKIQAVFDGNRSGNSWNVQGDLIDELEFTAQSKHNKAMMGETLVVKKGDLIKIKIKVHDPAEANNCPFDFENPSLAQIGISQPLNKPVLDHIDLIAATVTGNVPMSNAEDVVATDYQTDAKVIATFERRGGIDKDGYMTFVTKLKADQPMFVRLRGTNMPAGVPFETDEAGNPLADYEASDALYATMDAEELEAKLIEGTTIATNSKLDEVAEAYADLWFYSNPIFIDVVDKDRKHKHHKHHKK
ncbi:hypothetical protein SAMN02745165_01561 [Malonomonas rubra DSM 5091]|uniref:Uncharacterized protein n=1 Tax=Malonomonas rubra DSM 5091 TaxID=1122189 RepID=A0A1M6GIJ3_MALRU|nr:hypothetical protein [Malonomonas rubra]SHJ09700.1 hypothetical protein SAMN02745165_01561 [Malonomonas rubra DSM 5091]